MFRKRSGNLLPDACSATSYQSDAAIQDSIFEVADGASPPVDRSNTWGLLHPFPLCYYLPYHFRLTQLINARLVVAKLEQELLSMLAESLAPISSLKRRLR